MPNAKINGLILSGGRSLRMGQDKGQITYHGKPQREYLFDLLSKCCDHVFTSCKSTQEISAKLNPLTDLFELDSPLNGILTAFRHTPSVAWLSVPVDMPMIDQGVLKHLVDHRDEKKIATCFYDSDGEKPEPLLALWEPGAASLMEKYYEAGNMSVRGFLMAHNTNIIKAPSEKIYRNINTREDLFRFRAENL
jgi:molybdenum cofactor guanylyltransferase